MNFIPNINVDVIKAIARRDLRLYFTNPTGYVFITLFIFLSAAAAFWQERFFLNNLANLDQLNEFFPYLLVLFVPALTMGVWADERKQGTDELLFTLPGTDLEIVLGKYIAVYGVYSASLVLSLSHVLVLMFLGSPDLGLMIGNYFGYWLIGGALIAVGMLASLLSPNATIAFILGAVMCSFFTFIEPVSEIFGAAINDFLSSLGVSGYFGDFARGVISFSGFLYFLSVAATMLYVNILLTGRRHWPREAEGYPMWTHQAIRAAAVVIAVISANAIIGSSSLRFDVTAEQLHSLSGETKELIGDIPDDRPVLIQAYISSEVPQSYVQTRQTLLGFLNEIDAVAGDKVSVLIRETEMYSEEARDAREKFGIVPLGIPDQSSARMNIMNVFLGVAFTSGAEEDVIPFFDRGLPTEYELMRSIRTVAKTGRKRIGVLDTPAKLFGGLDFQTMRSDPAWQVVDELKKQYDVVQIAANQPITEILDGLLVALPSSLPQEQMDYLLNYIEAGNPALLLVDPLPAVNISLAPLEQPGASQNPFMQQSAPQEPKGDISTFMNALGVNWNTGAITWDTYNPHPDMATIPPEIIFLGASNERANSFNAEHAATSGLQELVMLYPGSVNPSGAEGFEFTPLLKSSNAAGSLSYYDLVRRTFFGTTIAQGLPHYPTQIEYTIAAQIKKEFAPADSGGVPTKINAIVIADIDFVSSQFFEIRRVGLANLNFDNVTFFLNCMDVLVGDESFIDLRKRRVRHRILETVDARTSMYTEQRLNEERQADIEAQTALAEAQQRLNMKVAEVRERTDLDEQTKQIMAQNLQEVENRRFEALKTNIEAEKEAKIARSKEEMESKIRSIQSIIRSLAVLLPPIPVLVVGVLIFVRRKRREKEGAAAERRLRS
ncbi:Gldg family protein [candidate division KSB1 bacterium]